MKPPFEIRNANVTDRPPEASTEQNRSEMAMSTLVHPSFGERTLEVTLRRGPYGCPLVTAHGEIDFSNRDQLAEMLEISTGSSKPVVFLDLRPLAFMDSAGLFVICRAHRDAQTRGRSLLIVRPKPSVFRLFSMTGLDTRLSFIGTLPNGTGAWMTTRPP